MHIISSGVTALATTDDSVITLLSGTTDMVREVTVVNAGSVGGFVSPNNGTTWAYIPGPGSRTFRFWVLPERLQTVKAKRIAGGSNMSGLYADAH